MNLELEVGDLETKTDSLQNQIWSLQHEFKEALAALSKLDRQLDYMNERINDLNLLLTRELIKDGTPPD